MESLKKIVSIIDLLMEKKELRLIEIYKNLNMNQSTGYRFVTELTKYGLLTRSNENKKFSLGPKFLSISSHIIENLNIREVAKDNLDKLSKITGETIHHAILHNNEIIYIDKREAIGPIRMSSRIGRRAPVYCTALGKVMVAFLDEKEFNKRLKDIKFTKLTNNTIINREKFISEIKKVKKLGFALDDEENEKGIRCMAAPIRDYTSKISSAVSITTILSKGRLKNVEEYKKILLEEAGKISKKLGYLDK